jgi:hypothetical protein
VGRVVFSKVQGQGSGPRGPKTQMLGRWPFTQIFFQNFRLNLTIFSVILFNSYFINKITGFNHFYSYEQKLMIIVTKIEKN